MQNYNSFFRATNMREFPGSAFLIYLCEPVIVIRYKVGDGELDSFKAFNNSIEEVKWVSELAWGKEKTVRERIIQQAWAFLDAEQ